jgi:hypothetical protein
MQARFFCCPVGSNHAKDGEAVIRELTAICEGNGEKLLTRSYHGSSEHDHYYVHCSSGKHETPRTVWSVRGGHQCSVTECKYARIARSRLAATRSVADLTAFAAERKPGGECRSTTYEGVKKEYDWYCPDHGEFRTTLSSMCAGGPDSFCPRCGIEKRAKSLMKFSSVEELNAFVAPFGLRCLSPAYAKNSLPLEWKCVNGGSLFAPWATMRLNIERGYGCLCEKCCALLPDEAPARCVRMRRYYTQEMVLQAVEYLTGISLQRNMRPLWLRSDKERPIELDGFNPGAAFAVEYQGEFHYRDRVNGAMRERIDFERIELCDRIKVARCRERGILLIVIPLIADRRPTAVLETVRVLLERVGVKIMDREYPFDYVPFAPDYKLQALRHDLADEGKILRESTWLGPRMPHRYWHKTMRHEFTVTPDNFYRRRAKGPRCGHPDCRRPFRRQPAPAA